MNLRKLVLAVALVCLPGVAHAQKDAAGCKDHPLFNRMRNHYIERCETSQFATMLKNAPQLSLGIGGHTDNVGGADANLKLSDARAAAVMKALVTRGVAAGRLTAKGYGQTAPIADNRTEDGRAKNRRVELVKK